MISWRHIGLISGAAALIALPAGIRILNHQHWAHVAAVRAAQQTAFTLELVEILRSGPDLDGSGRISRRIIIAQRSDGSRSQTDVYFPGQPGEHQTREIINADMRHIKAWDSVGMKTTGAPWPQSSVRLYWLRQPTPESTCALNASGNPALPAAYHFAGTEMIDGILTAKFVRENPHTEAWHAPQLNCAEVHRLIIFRACCTASASGAQDDSAQPITDSSELKMSRYSFGEPDDRLFGLSGLKEAAPSTARAAQAQKIGFTASQLDKVLADSKDADISYWQSRAAAGVRPE